MAIPAARDIKDTHPAVLRGSRRWAAITAGVALNPLPEAIYCKGAGDATLIQDDDTTEVAFTGFVAGVVYPLQPYKVKSGATATFIALY